MMEFNIENIVRENIKKLKPYSSARHEFTGAANIYLDANENPFGSSIANLPGIGTEIFFNRYPDPLQKKLKEKISSIKGVPAQNIFLGNGSDEAIDLLFRICCEPGRDNVITYPPTYGMYEVCAEMNNVQIKKVTLTQNFQLDIEATARAIDAFTKMIFICSPNNPTGNSIDRDAIEILLNNFEGLVVVDEAYINYSRQKSFIAELTEYPNLVVLQTFSKAWGLAGLRLGMAFGSQPIIEYMNKVKYPYNINAATQGLALKALDEIDTINQWIRQTVEQRNLLIKELYQFSFVKTIHPSDANFILVKVNGAENIYQYLSAQGIIVRNRSAIILCDDCLRITIGTPEENQQLLETLKKYNV